MFSFIFYLSLDIIIIYFFIGKISLILILPKLDFFFNWDRHFLPPGAGPASAALSACETRPDFTIF